MDNEGRARTPQGRLLHARRARLARRLIIKLAMVCGGGAVPTFERSPQKCACLMWTLKHVPEGRFFRNIILNSSINITTWFMYIGRLIT